MLGPPASQEVPRGIHAEPGITGRSQLFVQVRKLDAVLLELVQYPPRAGVAPDLLDAPRAEQGASELLRAPPGLSQAIAGSLIEIRDLGLQTIDGKAQRAKQASPPTACEAPR